MGCTSAGQSVMETKGKVSIYKDTRSEGALKLYFPGAMTGNEAENLFAWELKKRGFTPENTLFADSSCPDEINHDDYNEDITLLF